MRNKIIAILALLTNGGIARIVKNPRHCEIWFKVKSWQSKT